MGAAKRRTPSPAWLAELKPYVPGKPVEELERELGIQGAIKLASNENPLGPSPKAREALVAAASQVNLYPDAGSYYLRERLAAHLDVAPSRLVVGNGSNEIITMLVRGFAEPGCNAVIGAESFIAYKVVLGAAGVERRAVPMPGLRHDLRAMAAACDADTRLLFLANPNNPTGTYNTRAELEELLATTPEHVLVVLDEAYVEYVDAADYPNGIELLSQRENLAVMRTFSKAYGLAGCRVGYAVVPEYVADVVNRLREPFNLNLTAQAAALAALDDTEFLARTVETNRTVREQMYAGLDALGLSYVRSQTNFVLVESPIGGPALYERLLRQGVIVRPLQPYGMLQHVRVSVGTESENTRFLAALAECLKD